MSPGEHPIEPNPEPTYPGGHMQIGPLSVSEQVANGWQKLCREQIPLVGLLGEPVSEGIDRMQYLPSPCQPGGHDPQRNEPCT